MGSSSLVTTPGVDAELQPGGRDYRRYALLKEQGLQIQTPSQDALQHVRDAAASTGDEARLSSTDIEVLALTLELHNSSSDTVILLTDDYSMQNIADTLHLSYLSLSQRGITKRFKWHCRCPGCKRDFGKPVDICPVCGTPTCLVRQRFRNEKKK